jgi:hypothetical protein
MPFTQLDSREIHATLQRLTQRIEERFPGAGLARVSRELTTLGQDCARQAELLGQPNWPIRIAVGAVVTFVVVAVVGALSVLQLRVEVREIVQLAQGIESAINDLVFLAIAIWFLVSIETRIKRQRALRYLHQLRAVAHIIDMHQLTKDPERVLHPGLDTVSSPKRQMSAEQLARYLDYCSEMLSLIGKVAALFVQRFNDSVVLVAVNEVEDLTTGLSNKVWQKITILESAERPSRLP